MDRNGWSRSSECAVGVRTVHDTPVRSIHASRPAPAPASNESDPRSRYDAVRLDAPNPLSEGYADAGIFPLVDVVKKHFKGVISDAGFHEQEAVLDMSGVDDTIAPVHLAQLTLNGP